MNITASPRFNGTSDKPKTGLNGLLRTLLVGTALLQGGCTPDTVTISKPQNIMDSTGDQSISIKYELTSDQTKLANLAQSISDSRQPESVSIQYTINPDKAQELIQSLRENPDKQ